MQEYLSVLFSYLLIVPSAVLCYAPMQGQLRYSKMRLILMGTGLFAVTAPICALVEYKFCTYSDPVFIPYCLMLFIAYQKTLRTHISQSFTIFSTVMVWLSYASNFAVLIDSIFHRDSAPVSGNFSVDAIHLALAVLFALILIYPLRKYGSELIGSFRDRKVWYTASIVSVIFILVCSFLKPMKYETLYVNHVRRSYIVLISSTFILHLLLCLIFHFIIMGMIRSQKAEEQNKLYEMRESHYLKQQRYIDENARVRHDFKHTIRTLKELSDKGDFDAVTAYIRQYSESLPENDTTAFCKNNAVNAVLNYYHQLAEKEKIDLNWKIDLPEDVPVKNVDLCNIIGNILDNAITACQEIPEEKRYILFTVTVQHNANLYFVGTNSFSGKVKLYNDRYLSTHRDGRGIGLNSVKSIAESYGGAALFDHKDNEFYSNVVLPIMK